jgi:NAD(P)-dependent dehydrogenase (short-subunit alcohol dehydrogenase family)
LDLQLNGKKALVTGGSRGIGKAAARQLALEGCDVAICSRSEGPLQEAAAEIAKETGRKIFPMVCDVMDKDSIQRFVERSAEELGGMHIVINNAARTGGTPGSVETATDEDILRDFEEKVVGYFRVVRAATPYMKEAGWGRVINVSGGTNRMPGVMVAGPVREIGLISLTKSMSNALGQYGITVNCVSPGLTLTEDFMERYEERAKREGITVDEVLGGVRNRTAIKHLITSEDIANVIAFICSPLAISITGEVVACMGGSSQEVHV